MWRSFPIHLALAVDLAQQASKVYGDEKVFSGSFFGGTAFSGEE